MDSEKNYRRAYWCDRIQTHVHADNNSKLAEIKFSDLECECLLLDEIVPLCIRTYTECKIIRKAMQDVHKANTDFSKMLEETDSNDRK